MHGVEIDLDGLADFLVQGHTFCDVVGFIIVLVEDCSFDEDDKKSNDNE